MAIDLTQGDRASRLEGAAVAVLGASFRGELILPGDQRYDDARRVWNGMVDRRPAIIARCTGVADVVAAVAFAQEQGLLVAVLAGVYIGALRPARTPPTRRGVQVPAGGADARRANGLHHTVADRTASEPMDR
jgi:hypothetical protein